MCDVNRANETLGEYAIFGMKASKRLGKANVRNKIKRRIRHIIRINSEHLFQKQKLCIVIPKKGFENIEFEKLKEELSRVIAKLK